MKPGWRNETSAARRYKGARAVLIADDGTAVGHLFQNIFNDWTFATETHFFLTPEVDCRGFTIRDFKCIAEQLLGEGHRMRRHTGEINR